MHVCIEWRCVKGAIAEFKVALEVDARNAGRVYREDKGQLLLWPSGRERVRGKSKDRVSC